MGKSIVSPALAEKVKELNSKLAKDWNSSSSWCESIENGASTYYMNFGAMRTITFQGLNRSHTEDEVIMTIPSGHRPLTNTYTTGNIGGTAVVIRLRSDNGQVSLYSANSAGYGRIYFSASYVAL